MSWLDSLCGLSLSLPNGLIGFRPSGPRKYWSKSEVVLSSTGPGEGSGTGVSCYLVLNNHL